MKSRLLAASIVALGLVAVAAPAMAQGIEIGRDGVRLVDPRVERDREYRRDRDRDDDVRAGISQREAVRIARRQGLDDLDSVTERRRSFRVVGADRRGDDIRVDIDKTSGQVISVR